MMDKQKDINVQELQKEDESVQKILETDYDIQRQINNVRSKYCEPVLNMLEEGSLYHGDLAEKLNLSPSGLNAIIKKMQESPVPLIHTDQVGKYKIYSLSEEVKRFWNKKKHRQIYLDTKSVSIPGEITLFSELQRYVEIAGEQWKEILGLLLQGREKYYGKELIDCFETFIQQVEKAVIEKSDDLERMKKFLKNDVLLYLLDEYINEKIKCEKNIEQYIGEECDQRKIKWMKQALEKEENKGKGETN